MTDLVARGLNGPILDELGDTIVELLTNLRPGEVRVVPRVRLDADAPTALGHAKHKCPPVLRVQIGVRQHKQTLVLTQLQVLLKVFKYLARVELLDLGVRAHAC